MSATVKPLGRRLAPLGVAPDISIVVSVYDEEGNLRELYRHLVPILERLALRWEIVVPDDGSKDGTWREIVSLYRNDSRVKGIRLSRNFGHQYALLAGLAHARGRAVVTMDADLQHPPEVIEQLVREWRAGAKIVHAIRLDDDRTPRLKRLTSRIFYRLYSFLGGVHLEEGMADFRLLDRDVVDALLRFPEQGVFLRGLVQWVGFPSAKVRFKVGRRFRGRSKYTFRKMLALAWTGISDFSVVPLHLGVLLGFVTSGLAVLALIYALWSKLFTEHVVPGWASEVAIIALLFGILFVLLGIIGEYVGRILVEVKRRPRYLVMERVGVPAASALFEEAAFESPEPLQISEG